MKQVSQGEAKGHGSRMMARASAAAGSLGLIGALAIGAWAVLPTSSHVSAASTSLTTVAHRLRAPAAGGILHAVYSLHRADSDTTLDMWAQMDASGGIKRTTIVSRDANGTLLSRTIIVGGQATTYNAKTNDIRQAEDQEVAPLPLDTVGLGNLIRSARAGQATRASILSSQMIDGNAVDGVSVNEGQAQLQLYVDHGNGVTRREVLVGGGQQLWSATLVRFESVAAPIVAADTFTLDAPATAHLVVTPDGSPNLGTQEISVAQWVAYPNRPVLVLQGDPLGLLLQDARYTGSEHDAMLNAAYQGGSRAFYVSIWTTDHGLPATSDNFDGSTNPVIVTQNAQAESLPIAGVTVQGQYFEVPIQGTSQVSRVIDFAQGEARIRLTGDGMARSEFDTVVNALVDGRSHPEVVVQLQQELTNAGPNTPH